MIKSKLQYAVTAKKLAEFKAALAAVKEKNDINPVLQEIQVNALTAQIEILEEEIEEYTLAEEQPNMATNA